MSPKRMQLLACVLLAAGGVAMLLSGYAMGGATAVAVAALLAVVTIGRPSQ